MNITIKIKNERQILSKFNNLDKNVSSGLSKIIGRLGGEAYKKSIEVIKKGTGMWKSPIDTGQMWQGIKMKSAGLTAKVQTSPRTHYALYVHDGTPKMIERPFFEITAKEHKDYFQKEFKKQLDNLINLSLR